MEKILLCLTIVRHKSIFSEIFGADSGKILLCLTLVQITEKILLCPTILFLPCKKRYCIYIYIYIYMSSLGSCISFHYTYEPGFCSSLVWKLGAEGRPQWHNGYEHRSLTAMGFSLSH